MYTIADDFWDSYFRHKKEMRSLRREATNAPVLRRITSVGINEVPDRIVHTNQAGRNNRPQIRNITGEWNTHSHPGANSSHFRNR